MSRPPDGPGRVPWWARAGALAASVLLLVLTAWLVGTSALTAGIAVLRPLPVAVALLPGFTATAAQAVRWYVLGNRRGIPLTYRRALADCYASSAANMVLPGGLAGDAVRAGVYRRSGDRGWRSSLTAIGAERLSATAGLFTGAAIVAAVQAPGAYAVIGGLGLVAAACVAAALLCMRGLSAAAHVAVWVSALVTVGSFVVLYLTAMIALGGPVQPAAALVGLAAMSLPVGVGGWGTRELTVGLVAGPLSLDADAAVAASAAYGLLAVVSTTPGIVVLLARGVLRWRHPQRRDRSVEPVDQLR